MRLLSINFVVIFEGNGVLLAHRRSGINIQVLRNARGVGGVSFPRKTCYEGVRFNVISVTRGWVGVKFPGKKRYVTLEWPHTSCSG